jgi:hypothetical protein
MKKRDLIKLQGALTTIEGRTFTIKFSYFIAKNKIMIKNEFDVLNEVRKPSAEYIEYDTVRAELANRLADRTEDGKPKIENNNFIIVENVDEFKTEMDKLKYKYAKAIEDFEQKQKDFEALLEEEFEYQGPKIDFKDIPQNIEPSILEALIAADLIIEETVE